MVLPELFVAALISGISCVNAAIPGSAWARARDGRFLLLVGANGGLAILGGVWAWGELPFAPPTWAAPALVPELVVLAVALLLLSATLWPRHA